MMRTTLYAAALLLSAGAFAASTVVWADSPASAIVGIGSIGDTPASGASGSTTGTIASPGASPAVHPEELSVPNVAMALAAFGYDRIRSEEHTSELQSLMRISYAVFCLKKKKHNNKENKTIKRKRN